MNLLQRISALCEGSQVFSLRPWLSLEDSEFPMVLRPYILQNIRTVVNLLLRKNYNQDMTTESRVQGL